MVLEGCASTAQVTKTGGPSLQEAQRETYNGPKTRVAIAPFVDKSGKGKMTNAIGDGMTDTLTTLLFHTKRYIVLERQALPHVQEEQPRAAARRGRQQPLASKVAMEDAELLVTGAVTEFDPEAGGEKKLDGKIEFKTPIEKAIRLALDEAVKFNVGQTPAQYYRYPSKDSTTAASASVSFPKFVRVAGALVKIRTGARETFQPIVTGAKGTQLPVIDAQDQWYKVRVTGGREGWIASWATATQP
jgi:TolB-like protein